MADSVRYRDWYEKALKDFQTSKILLKHGGDYSIIAFHCQQAIEKMLKGYILKYTSQLTEGHSLVFLCRRASIVSGNNELRQYLRECAFVNQFYIETRYPSDVFLELDEEEVMECINIAAALLDELSDA